MLSLLTYIEESLLINIDILVAPQRIGVSKEAKRRTSELNRLARRLTELQHDIANSVNPPEDTDMILYNIYKNEVERCEQQLITISTS